MTGIFYAYLFFLGPTCGLLLKGKAGMAMLFFFLPVAGTLAGLVSLFRLAQPTSWWARHRYGTHQMKQARARYPDAPPDAARHLPAIAAFVAFVFGPAMIVIGLLAPSV